MTYYGFNSDNVCIFTASGPVEPTDGMTVVASELDIDLATHDIKLDGNKIVATAREEEEA